MKEIKSFYGLGCDSEYVINGVCYKVSLRFAPVNICRIENTISDKVEKYVGSDFAHLTLMPIEDKIEQEYVTTAGKEE